MANHEGTQNDSSKSLSTIDSFTMRVAGRGQAALDEFFPLEQRQGIFDKIKAFVVANPKLAVCIRLSFGMSNGPGLADTENSGVRRNQYRTHGNPGDHILDLYFINRNLFTGVRLTGRSCWKCSLHSDLCWHWLRNIGTDHLTHNNGRLSTFLFSLGGILCPPTRPGFRAR